MSYFDPSSTNALDRRLAMRDRVRQINAAIVKVAGTVQTTGSGEGLLTVDFGYTFVEKPALSLGGELHPTSSLVAGQYPTVSVIVSAWTQPTPVSSSISNNYYTGAVFAIVTTGPTDQVVIVHWQVEGMALMSPGNTPPTA